MRREQASKAKRETGVRSLDLTRYFVGRRRLLRLVGIDEPREARYFLHDELNKVHHECSSIAFSEESITWGR